MAEQFSAEWARGIIEGGVEKAQSLINDPDQVNDLLGQLQEKLADVPETVKTAFMNIPLMAQMVKSYVTREYTEVSPKVVISLVSAFLYLVKKDDLISDAIPVIGFADDLAVVAVVMAINEPELAAYAAWREQQEADQGVLGATAISADIDQDVVIDRDVFAEDDARGLDIE